MIQRTMVLLFSTNQHYPWAVGTWRWRHQNRVFGTLGTTHTT